MEEFIVRSRPWYRRWWGVVLLVLAVLVTTAVFLFILITWRFWRQIKTGQAIQLPGYLGGGFSSVQGGSATPSGAVSASDRAILENPASPFLGNAGAPVVIVEFTDFKCPNCKAAAPIIKQVLQKYPTKVKYILRHFPVETTHPGASELSQLFYCAGKQGKQWPLYDWIFANQDTIPEHLDAAGRAAIAAANDLNDDTVQECLATPAPLTAVNRDYVDGARFNVRGTPTFFVNGERVEGVVPFSAWDSFLQRF